MSELKAKEEGQPTQSPNSQQNQLHCPHATQQPNSVTTIVESVPIAQAGAPEVSVSKLGETEIVRNAYSALTEFLSARTGDGLFPLVAYGLDFNKPSWFGVLTTTIADLPLARELVERITRQPYSTNRFIILDKLAEIAAKNSEVMRFSSVEILGLNANDPEHRSLINRLVSFCAASRWLNRSFVLVDIVGFSKLSTPAQLSARMSLNLAIDQCFRRMRPLAHPSRAVLPPIRGFNRISTGDGFYIWNYDSSEEGHVALFLLMIYLMAHTEYMRKTQRNLLELRAAFAVGEAFTFPSDGPGPVPPSDLSAADLEFTADAIGPVLNDLRRLLDVASAGQVLVAPFDEEGRPDRHHERLNLQTMLERIRTEILPRELDPPDPIKPRDIILQTNPKEMMRFADKHGETHYALNVCGSIPVVIFEKEWLGPVAASQPVWRKNLYMQNVGLAPDRSPQIQSLAFRNFQGSFRPPNQRDVDDQPAAAPATYATRQRTWHKH